MSAYKLKPKSENYSCCVKNCDDFFKNLYREFHVFPTSPDIRRSWMQILGLKTINYDTLVCDKHFRPEDYVGGKKKRLAMPSLYLDLEMKQEVGDQVSEQVNVEMTAQQEIVNTFEYACRVCLENSDQIIWIFDTSDMEKNIAELFKYVTGLEVSENDNFPQYVCKTCFYKILEASQLKKKALDSHFVLKNRMDTDMAEETEFLSAENYEDISKPELLPYELTYSEENEMEDSMSIQIDSTQNLEKEPEIQSEVPLETFHCEHCNVDINVKSKNHHIKMHEKQGLDPIKECESCQKKLYLKVEVSAHTECSRTFNNLCEPCGVKFDNSTKFKSHLNEEHFENGFYVCPERDCEVEEKTILNAYLHIKWHFCNRERHKNPHSFTCDLCGLNIEQKVDLWRHIKTIHSNLKKKHACGSCSQFFTSLIALKDHKSKEHNTKAPISCEKCGETFQLKFQYMYHSRNEICGDGKRTRKKL